MINFDSENKERKMSVDHFINTPSFGFSSCPTPSSEIGVARMGTPYGFTFEGWDNVCGVTPDHGKNWDHLLDQIRANEDLPKGIFNP
ncbi:MAG: hypothetical protein ACW99A_22570 [Candidatus Kariarchaeaceae archaeon]|jgi:hypothetical protein